MSKIETVTYTVRAGGLQPVSPGCPSGGIPVKYVMQTFGAEKVVIEILPATTQLIKSYDMQGMKPTDNIQDPAYIATTYVSASYSGRGMRDTDGNLVYQGQLNHVPEFVDEEEVPGWD